MPPRELILLNPYSYPGQNSLVLSQEDMACWLNGYSALWHPAALWQAVKPPRCDTPYDHEQPKAGYVYALPESPPLLLPDDWDQRVRDAGAIAFRVTTDRATTLHNLREALAAQADKPEGQDKLLALPPEQVGPFFGVGFGHLLLGSLSEAMEHANLLEHDAFWDDVPTALAALGGLPYAPKQAPVSDYSPPTSSDYDEYQPPPGTEEAPTDGDNPGAAQPTEESIEGAPAEVEAPPDSEGAAAEAPAIPPADSWLNHLQSAASRLVSAREVLYPVTIHLLDLLVLDEKRFGDPWPASLEHGLGLNVVACASLLEKLAQTQPQKLDELRKHVEDERAEVCGGCYVEREDPLLPVDSQLWNLLHGQEMSRKLLGREIQVFARKRFGLHPQL